MYSIIVLWLVIGLLSKVKWNISASEMFYDSVAGISDYFAGYEYCLSKLKKTCSQWWGNFCSYNRNIGMNHFKRITCIFWTLCFNFYDNGSSFLNTEYIFGCRDHLSFLRDDVLHHLSFKVCLLNECVDLSCWRSMENCYY